MKKIILFLAVVDRHTDFRTNNLVGRL